MPYDTLIDMFYQSYAQGGMPNINGSAFVTDNVHAGRQHLLSKAATDAFDRAETQFFDPKYSADITVWPLRQMSALSILPKTTYLEKGDSIKVVSADAATPADVTAGITGGTQLYATYDTPTITDIIGGDSIGIRPKIIATNWKMDLDYILKNTAQYAPQFDAAWAKKYFTEYHINAIDNMLLECVDTTANLSIESIDRIVSTSAEGGYTDATTDVEIHGIAARDSSTVYDAQVDTSSSSRVLSLDMIDTVLTSMQPYTSSARNILGLAHPKVLNMIQDLLGSRQRFNDAIGNVELTVNGINTRAGKEAGFQVATFTGGGLGPIPLIPDSNVDLAGSTIPASNGTIFFLDKDHIELRVAMPQSYWATTEQQFAVIDYAETRHLILYSAELIANRFNCHGAVKYLSGT